MLTKESDHIKVSGHVGTWYVVDEAWYVLTPDTPKGPKTMYVHCFLLEHERYGDEAANVIVDENGQLIMEEVWNGFEDLDEVGWEAVSEQEYKSKAGAHPGVLLVGP